MDTWVWVVIGVIVAVVVFGVLLSAPRTRRPRSLQDQFGREFDPEDDGEDASTSEREVEEVRGHDNVERLR